MKRLLTLAVCVVGFAFAAEWMAPNGQKYDIGTMPQFQDGDRVLWSGDSITKWEMSYFRYVENFYLTRYPKRRIVFCSGGISGSTAPSVLARFDYDVACWRPTYISLMLGMNDTGSHHFMEKAAADVDRKQKTILLKREEYRRNMTELTGKMKALPTVRQLTLLSPTYWDEYAETVPRPGIERMAGRDAELKVYAGIAAELAATNGFAFVNTQIPLREYHFAEVKKNPAFNFLPDRCHPGIEAYVMVAHALLAAQGVTPYRAEIAIGVGGKAATKGCIVSPLRRSGNAVELEYTGEALPCVFEEKPADALPLMGGFTLDLRGSFVVRVAQASGNCRILCDGQVLGNFSGEQLCAGVELARNSAFADVRQAKEVVALNAKRLQLRTSGVYREYVEVKGRIGYQRQLAILLKKPPLPEDDFAALDELFKRGNVRDPDLMKTYYRNGKDEVRAAWRASVEALDAKIYEANQPRRHTLRIEKL